MMMKQDFGVAVTAGLFGLLLAPALALAAPAGYERSGLYQCSGNQFVARSIDDADFLTGQKTQFGRAVKKDAFIRAGDYAAWNGARYAQNGPGYAYVPKNSGLTVASLTASGVDVPAATLDYLNAQAGMAVERNEPCLSAAAWQQAWAHRFVVQTQFIRLRGLAASCRYQGGQFNEAAMACTGTRPDLSAGTR
jgi:hypothetical protein